MFRLVIRIARKSNPFFVLYFRNTGLRKDDEACNLTVNFISFYGSWWILMEERNVVRWSRLLSAAVLVIAVLTLAGWQFDVEFFKRPLPGTMPMNPFTAVLFILTVCAFILTVSDQQTHSKRNFILGLTGIIAAVSTYKIIQVVFDLNFMLDTTLYTDKLAIDRDENKLNRMPLVTAINFLLIVLSLLHLFSRKNKYVIFAQRCALLVMLSGLFFLLGYIYRVPEFFSSEYYFPMAAHTAVGFLFLSIAFLFANPKKGLMKQLTSSYAGSVIARILIPLVIILPVLIGYIRLWGHWYGILSTELGVTSIVLSFIIIFVLLIIFNTNSLNKKDVQQKEDAWHLQYYNTQLHDANHEVASANEELRAALEELTTTNEELITSNENLAELNDKLEIAKETIRQQAAEIIQRKDDQLSEYRRNIDIIFTNTQEGMLLLDANSTVILFNKTFEAFIYSVAGIQPKVGMLLSDVVVKERRDAAHLLYTKALQGEAVAAEAYFNAAGKELVHLLRYEPVHQFGKVTHVIIMSMDITEKKNREKAILQSEANLKAIFDNTPDAFILLANDRKIIAYNKAYLHRFMLHFDTEPEIGTDIVRYIPESRKESFQAMLERTSQGATVLYEVESFVNEKPLWSSVMITRVKNESDEMVGYCLNIRDTTEIKNAEVALREREEKFRALVEYSDDVFCLVDLNGAIHYASPSLTRKLGYTSKDLQTLQGHDLIHPDDLEQYTRDWQDIVQNQGKLIAITCRARHKDGHWLWMQGTSINLTHIPSVKGIVATYRDISPQKEYENKITSIAKELSVLIETSNVPIFGLDENGAINEWNDVTAQVMQLSKSDALGKKWIEEFIEEPYQETVSHLFARAIRGHALNNFELPVLTRNGESIILLLSASPRYNAEEQIKGIIIVAQNITELIDYRKGLEKMVQDRTRELNDALQKEKELAELKTKFVSMASHEFRTPLSTISLATGFIRRYKTKIPPEDIDKKLDDIVRQVEHMNYLLEDVLTVGKAESGKVMVGVMPIEVNVFFDSISTEVYQSTGKTHRIRLDIACDQQVIASDPRMLRIIVVNLLTNAIKFSPGKNSVWLNVACSNNTLQLKVKDQGLGIPEDDMEKLFHSFHRASNASTIQGTGLGLSIVRKTVDLLGGFIQVESKLNEGTTFTISIPIDGRQENISSG